MFNITPIAAFNDNYIWCLSNAEQDAVLVDPGDGSVALQYLAAQQLQLSAILITHHHADHTGGIDTLREQFPNVLVYGPQNPAIKGITHALSDGDSIDVVGETLHVIAVPGHTLDHIAFYLPHPQQPSLFCGDTLFAAGCGRIFEGDPATMLASLSKLAQLPAATAIYCAHEYTLANIEFARAVEPANSALKARQQQCQQLRQQQQPTLPSTLAEELATNPFLRCQQQSVAAAASQYSGQACNDEIATFTAIREWKNSF
jgi:hydroxyacylglutathione hydrolase